MNVGLVIGNGPSLASMPLSFLCKYPSIGSNAIYLLSGFTPTYFTAIAPVNRKDFVERVNAMNCIKIVGERVLKEQPLQNVIKVKKGAANTFSTNPFEIPACEGWTVTYFNLQLAYYLKWDIVLLVGVDHWSSGNFSHFAPDYIQQKFEDSDQNDLTIPYYKLARSYFDKAGRKVVNITKGSALNVFEKQDWSLW